METTTEGLYEQLINKLVASRLNELDKNHFYIKHTLLDKQEAAKSLTQYLSNVIKTRDHNSHHVHVLDMKF